MEYQTFKIISVLIAIIVFLTIAIIGLTTGLLREGAGKPCSFHKFQLWIWTLVICPTFALYWGYSAGHIAFINQTALVLLGISGATTVAAEVISSAQQNNPARNLSLKAVNVPATGFWSDILKDDHNELSIARLQQLIFTFIFVGIYVCTFFSFQNGVPQYPDFNTNAYVLMGISSGAFLVGKGLNK